MTRDTPPACPDADAGADASARDDTGATAVISHRVRHDRQADYERWMAEIAPLSRAAPGHLDWHVIRPIPGLTETFTVIIRFDTCEHLQAWMASADRRRLIEAVSPLLESGDDFFIRSGLDFWFTPAGAKAQLPVRWKQALVTWSAIYPLVLLVPLLVAPVLSALGLAGHPPLTMLAVTGIVVSLMVWVVMPRYTRLLRRWLFA